MSRHFEVQDHYFNQAQQMGYKARSVFKLQEIQAKYHLVKLNNHVLDIGAAPGSFLQILSRWVGPAGKVIGFDLQKIQDLGLKNTKTFIADLNNLDEVNQQLNNLTIKQLNNLTIKQLNNLAIKQFNNLTIKQFNVIISDVAPKTVGRPDSEQYQSILLSQKALELAKVKLTTNGHLILKVFQGADFNEFLSFIKPSFKKIKLFKPKASRPRSKEIYLICFNFKNNL